MPHTVEELTAKGPGAASYQLPAPPPRSQPTASLLGTLVFKEVHDLALTLRFTVGTVIAVILAVLAAYIGSLDYNARLDSYQTKLKLNQDALRRTTVYSFVRPTVVRPPEPLSILHHGLEARVGTDFWVAVDVEHTEAEGENRGNEYLSIFSEVDLTVVVAVILGLLALLFTFDAVCGEREAGTLKLILSYSLSRSQLLLGKYAGAWITLLLPTLMACAASLLVMGSVAQVRFGAQEAVRIGLLFAGYVLYLSLMLLLGLLISTFAQRSSVALVFSAFAWFFFVTVVPNLAAMVPDYVGNRARVYQTAQEGLRQADKELEAAVRAIKDPRDLEQEPRDPMALYYYAISNSSRGLTAWECRWGDAKYYEALRHFFGERLIPLSLKFAARRAEVWRHYIRYRGRQAALARGLSFLSPTAVFESTAGFLSGTSDADYNHFIGLASQYRKTLLDYFQRRSIFTSRKWFTEDPPDQDHSWPMLLLGRTADEMAATGQNPGVVLNKLIHSQETWAKAAQLEKQAQQRADWYLSLGELPGFTYARLTTSTILVHILPETAYLLLVNLILFLAAHVRFVRYDVR